MTLKYFTKQLVLMFDHQRQKLHQLHDLVLLLGTLIHDNGSYQTNSAYNNILITVCRSVSVAHCVIHQMHEACLGRLALH